MVSHGSSRIDRWRLICFLAILLFPLILNPGNPAFADDVVFTKHIISTGLKGANCVHAGDLDGDGDVDVLATGNDEDHISWFVNDGAIDPDFSEYPIGSGLRTPRSPFVCDINSDGRPDVLVGDYAGDDIIWYRNNGGNPPSFTRRGITGSADGIREVMAADLDGDEDLDIAAAIQFDDAIAWYENDGGVQPSFTPHILTRVFKDPRSVFVDDLDGDKDVDILACGNIYDEISWFENKGLFAPQFKHIVTIDTDLVYEPDQGFADGPNQIHAADLDGDEDTDLLSASFNDHTIAWYENDGAVPPHFTPRAITESALNATAVVTGDIDLDGDLDVIGAANQSNTVEWYRNEGGIPLAFTPFTISTTQIMPNDIYVADLDKDGDLDVLAVSWGDNTIAWYENHIRSHPLNMTLIDEDGQNDPDPEWTSDTQVKLKVQSIPLGATFIDMDEDPQFQSASTKSIDGSEYSYEFDTPVNELKTVWVRVRKGAEEDWITSDTIGLDSVVPRPPSTPEHGGAVSIETDVMFEWLAATDPESGSGIAAYHCQVGTSPGGADVFNQRIGAELSQTIAGQRGQTLYCRVRPFDRAGNAGDWSDSSSGVFIDRPPHQPEVTIDPLHPKTRDDIQATALATDPDGDPIMEYEYAWERDDGFPVTGPTLRSDMTTRGEFWLCRARARDIHGLWGQWETAIFDWSPYFEIENTPPTQPLIHILPHAPMSGDDIVMEVLKYSTDADDDPFDYAIQWFKSDDGGQNWIHKQELDDQSQLHQLYLSDGEIWKVYLIPMETGTGVVGPFGWDQVYIGTNNPPVLSFNLIQATVSASGAQLHVDWQYVDLDGDACTVDLFWTDPGETEFQPIAEGLAADDGQFLGLVDICADRAFRCHAIVMDSKGAVTRIASSIVELNAVRYGWQMYP